MTNKILVVDDEEDLLTLVKGILEGEGFQVSTVSSGQECLDALKKEKFDLVILDMMMPGMSGRETCEKIRSNPDTKNMKVVFLTVARFSEAGKGTLTDLKVLDYITKPFENEDLVKRVKKILGK
jgi:DNA-binding response OmpR family regulator